MARRTRYVTLAAAMLVAAGTLSACTSKTPDAGDAVGAFLAGWKAHNFGSSVKFVDATGAVVAPNTVSTQITKLSGDLASKPPTFTTAKPHVKGSDATEAVTVHWPASPTVIWTYQTTVPLKLLADTGEENKTWHVVWSPTVLQPHLTANDTLRVHTLAPQRGEILDGSGKAIVTAHDVVAVGVEPSRVKDITSLVAALDRAFRSVDVDLDLSGLPAQVKAAKPNAFVTVVTLRKEVYEQIRAQIHDLPGTVFQDGTQQLAPTATFARALLGTVGPVTKERMDANPGKYAITDQIGFGGVQQQYDDVLRGKAGVDIVVSSQGPSPDGSPSPETVLDNVDPVAGKSVQTTIDVNVQNAADKALSKETKPAAIIAMRISDGHILAVANGPGAAGYDLALQAQVPPGSTFKTITATNVLESGKETTSSVVNCPKQLVVDGRTFTNDGGEAFGEVPLLDDYARSCNTAFASLAPKLGPNGLQTTAAQLGIGGKWSVGVPTFAGSVAADGSAVDQAAAAFGQGKTLVSPVALASAVSAVARGYWMAPTVMVNPAVSGNPGKGTPLKPATVAAMKTMMRAVVTSGTATPCNGIAGGPVYGKTGTAEYNNDPNDSHSWFMGYQGDVAFAVFVENGGLSTTAAVPIAKNFLTSLHATA
ncbi:MAG TPA: penicillin-binding transpeptidase domain-containing protein [Micromonosporaceae bacterium]